MKGLRSLATIAGSFQRIIVDGFFVTIQPITGRIAAIVGCVESSTTHPTLGTITGFG